MSCTFPANFLDSVYIFIHSLPPDHSPFWAAGDFPISVCIFCKPLAYSNEETANVHSVRDRIFCTKPCMRSVLSPRVLWIKPGLVDSTSRYSLFPSPLFFCQNKSEGCHSLHARRPRLKQFGHFCFMSTIDLVETG